MSSTLSAPIIAPYRSEAFAEDLFDDEPSSPPWSWGQAALATVLCALPAAMALTGGALTLLGGQA